MTATEAKWAGRVQEWRASGKSADAFAEDRDFEASTLRVWASKLKAAAAARATIPMARVVRRRPRPALAVVASELEVAVGGARLVVRRGFDASLLRDVVAALGGSK